MFFKVILSYKSLDYYHGDYITIEIELPYACTEVCGYCVGTEVYRCYEVCSRKRHHDDNTKFK